MYQVSDLWKAGRISEAASQGYTTVAFGLRIRAPLLNQVVLGNRNTPFEAEAEARTIGNAFGQSYGLMNNRSNNEINSKARASKHRLDILPCAQIHDAGYWRVRDNLEVLTQLNQWVGDAFSWQELPEIWHDEVKLSGELDIFYPTWADAFTLPNNASQAELVEVITSEVTKRKEKK